MKNLNILLPFFSFISVIICINSYKGRKNFICGTSKYDSNPISANNVILNDINQPLYLRQLEDTDEDGFKQLNIYLDLVNIEQEIEDNELEDYKDIIINSLNRTKNVLETLLKVKLLENDYFFTDEEIKKLNINNWDKSKFGTDAYNNNKITMKSLGTDLIIFSRFADNGELDEDVLCHASPKIFDNKTAQPLIGIININKNIDLTKYKSQEFMDSIMIHEFIHILGFTPFYLKYFNYIFTRENAYGVNKSFINSTKALQIARKYYNCSSLDGIELESLASESNSSHWEARILLGDIMNEIIYPEEQVLSEITLALLEDFGYYKANYYTGGLMRFGKNKGCDFLNTKCVNDELVNPYFENEFFNLNDIEPSCSSGRQSRTYNLIYYYSNISKQFRYYDNEKWGGWETADFCPVAQEYESESVERYYVGDRKSVV